MSTLVSYSSVVLAVGIVGMSDTVDRFFPFKGGIILMQEIRMLPYNHIVPPTTSLEKLHTNKLKSGNV